MRRSSAGQAHSGPDIARLRLNEIAKLIKHRQGGLTDTDDVDVYLPVIAHHLPLTKRGLRHALVKWCLAWFEQLPSETSLTAAVFSKRKRYTADRLGNVLRVNVAEREALALRTIGAFDASKEERERRRQNRERERLRTKRRKAGIQPRDQFLATAKTTLRPWESEGLTRAKWYRLGRHKCAEEQTKLAATHLSQPP